MNGLVAGPLTAVMSVQVPLRLSEIDGDGAVPAFELMSASRTELAVGVKLAVVAEVVPPALPRSTGVPIAKT
jgi:tetrahydromethanopterin S-methyltransferase subunit F